MPWELHHNCAMGACWLHCNKLTVPRMEMKLGTHACYIIPCFHDNHILFEQHQIASGTLHSSNLLTVALMEMKLGTNAFTSSLLKLANGSKHGDEAWYACVFISMTTTGIFLVVMETMSNAFVPSFNIIFLYLHAWYS